VEGALSLDSSFLVDLERERARRVEGPAHTLLGQYQSALLLISVTAAGELACGASLAAREKWNRFLAPFRLLPLDARAAWEYGSAFRYLSANGLLIGTNDLWIAATALANGLPLVTRNTREFRRVPRLDVVGYG
jgi:tRNA(fMet)-specific endonuclease VapC